MSKQSKNGVTMPKEGTTTRAIWDRATAMSEELDRPVATKELIADMEPNGFKKPTISKQYSNWKKFHGISGRVTPPAEMTTPPAPKTDKTETPEEVPTGGGIVIIPDYEEGEAYDKGFDSFASGLQLTDNPFNIDGECDLHSAWRDGYEAASQAD